MPSRSLVRWRTERSRELDEIVAAHASVGGTGPGRRYATQQVNHAYVMLLASQFQRFCRDLHSEAADIIANATQPPALAPIMKERLVAGRQLDSGNAQPGSVGSDFGRFFLSKFWSEVEALNPLHDDRKTALAELNQWRNAIAHQDFSEVGSAPPGLAQVRRWRVNCDVLATAFDTVMRARLRALVGSPPW